jgi:hypothetical protein
MHSREISAWVVFFRCIHKMFHLTLILFRSVNSVIKSLHFEQDFYEKWNCHQVFARSIMWIHNWSDCSISVMWKLADTSSTPSSSFDKQKMRPCSVTLNQEVGCWFFQACKLGICATLGQFTQALLPSKLFQFLSEALFMHCVLFIIHEVLYISVISGTQSLWAF